MEVISNILKNIRLNLTAVGPSAVLIVLILSVAALGIFGAGELADRAMGFMYFMGAIVGVTLASRT